MEDFDGYPLGCGFINTNSHIRVRMLSGGRTALTGSFCGCAFKMPGITGRLWRTPRAAALSSARRIFSPGIVIDKFSDVLVVESLALGIDRLKPVLLALLTEILAQDGISIRGIYERSDAKVRLQEGNGADQGLYRSGL